MARGVRGSGPKGKRTKFTVPDFNSGAGTINLLVVAKATDMGSMRKQLDVIEAMCGQLDLETKHMNITGAID